MSRPKVTLFLLLMINPCVSIEFISNSQRNASQQIGTTNGDILIGGLFPVHSQNSDRNSQPCGVLNHERGIHRLEAMLYAVDLINKDQNILPNLTIGVGIRDTCGQDTHALEESVHFFSIKSADREQCPKNNKVNNAVAVIGAAASDVSIAVANLMRLFKVPQVSYASTSPDLNDRVRFAYFLRTVPPDTYQALAMVDIISHFNWTSVHGIYSSGNYGKKGMHKFREMAGKKGICVISASQVKTDTNYFGLLKSLTTFADTKVVVLFLTTEHIQLLLDASSKLSFDFKWLASDYWGTRTRFINKPNLQKAAEGSVTLTLQTHKMPGFIDYFKSLNVSTNQRNPWFKSFWEETFNCTFSKSTLKLGQGKACLGNEVLPANYSFDDKIPYVIDAVTAVARGIHNMCKKLTDCHKRLEGDMVLKSIRNVSYNGTLGIVKFDENGSIAREYEIMEIVNGKYVRIGTWKNKLSIKVLAKPTKSFCASSCVAGEIKVPRKGLICCYNCHACGNDKYVTSKNQCSSCPENKKPNKTKDGCESLAERNIDHVWVIVMSSYSGLGIILTLAITFTFVYYNHTPIVKASGRDLSYPLLLGVLFCFMVPYVLLANPSTMTCGLSRFGLGFGFCICYTAIAIKCLRIERIYKTQLVSNNATQWTASESTDLLIMLVVVAVEALLAVIGMFIQKPVIEKQRVNNEIMLVCKLPNYDIALAYVYNIILIFVCTVFAFRTRKFPASFNESKYIGFVMYTACIVWIVMIPVYAGLSIDYRFIALCMNLSLSATGILVGIFAPKIYIAIFRPARNVRSRSGLSVRHVYSNQSFEDEVVASTRRMTTLTEVDIDFTSSSIQDASIPD